MKLNYMSDTMIDKTKSLPSFPIESKVLTLEEWFVLVENLIEIKDKKGKDKYRITPKDGIITFEETQQGKDGFNKFRLEVNDGINILAYKPEKWGLTFIPQGQSSPDGLIFISEPANPNVLYVIILEMKTDYSSPEHATKQIFQGKSIADSVIHFFTGYLEKDDSESHLFKQILNNDLKIYFIGIALTTYNKEIKNGNKIQKDDKKPKTIKAKLKKEYWQSKTMAYACLSDDNFFIFNQWVEVTNEAIGQLFDIIHRVKSDITRLNQRLAS